jgi:hypothetical protein
MGANGQGPSGTTEGRVLRWPGRVLTAEDLHRALNGQGELVLTPQAVITPLAAEELRSNGVRITRQAAEERPAGKAPWGFAQERSHPIVTSAVRSVARDGLLLTELAGDGEDLPCRWARALAEGVARGECRGCVLFCHDPGLVCCVGNKVPGLRAVAVVTVAQAAQAALSVGANLVAVEMPGRTFFEVRQIFRVLCAADGPACPSGAACALQELDGHAHR